jgi:hypothetical protein
VERHRLPAGEKCGDFSEVAPPRQTRVWQFLAHRFPTLPFTQKRLQYENIVAIWRNSRVKKSEKYSRIRKIVG